MSTIGSRIRYKRIEAGLSVDDVAARLGKNRATVYRYESNDIDNFPISVIGPLADILNTTPAYLMGWENANEDAWTSHFRARLLEEMAGANRADCIDACIDYDRLMAVASGKCDFTFSDACNIAADVGLSLDEMIGIGAKKSALDAESGLDMEIINLFLSLPESKKSEAVNYLRYLAESAKK